MKFELVTFANRVAVIDGLLDVNGGAPEYWTVTSVPGVIAPMMAVVVSIDENEIGRAPGGNLSWADETATRWESDTIFTFDRSAPQKPGCPLRHVYAVPLELPVHRVGGHTLTVTVEDARAEVRLGVVIGGH